MVSVMVDKTGPAHSDFLPYFERYQQKLRELEMLDLDDLQVETLGLFNQEPKICQKYAERFPKIFVDEYQDTNSLQVLILKALIQACRTSTALPRTFLVQRRSSCHEIIALLRLFSVDPPALWEKKSPSWESKKGETPSALLRVGPTLKRRR
jgi:hypothetical protein